VRAEKYTAPRNTLRFRRLSLSLRPAQQMPDQRNQEKNQEKIEDDLRDSRGGYGDAGKSQKCRYERYDEKN
jgi:hypothetical protein